jgi:uncharacterized iron-regulated membrane protein
MRHVIVILHRYFGLATALFLLVAGVTGAIIAWEQELDEWLNPRLFEVPDSSTALPTLAPLSLVDAVQRSDPRVRVRAFPLQYKAGRAAVIWVDAKVDPGTGQRYQTGYNHVFVDPSSGTIIGKRAWGKVALDREHLMSFLYKLHFSLHFPEIAGSDRWGVRFMGGVAGVWLFNTVIAFFLTLPRLGKGIPSGGKARIAPLRAEAVQPLKTDPAPKAPTASWWRRWQPAWLISHRGSAFRINFDLHRAGGLWFFATLLILAFTSFSLNLYREAFYPVMSLVSKVTPGPFELRQPAPLHQPIEPRVAWARLLECGSQEARSRGWSEPAGDVFYAESYGIQAVRFFSGDRDLGPAGLGVKTLYYDSQDGRLLGEQVPWKGTAADKFVQLQFPLHSGRLLGLPGRILISLTGLMVALLSASGVVIWWKKSRSGRAALKIRHESLRRQ